MKCAARFFVFVIFFLGAQKAFAQPVINSFSPASGPVGTSVIISGAGFNSTPANNIVFFGAVRATITAATASSLTVTVPSGATYQPISVSVNKLTGYSVKPFAVTFPGASTLTFNSFSAQPNIKTDLHPQDVVAFDFDGDGKPDLATPNFFSIGTQPASVSVIRNTSVAGAITFADQIVLTNGKFTNSIAGGDLNGDGKQDLVAASVADDLLSIFINTSSPGNISFAPKITLATKSPYSIAVADLNNDGKPDIAVVNFLLNTVSIYKNTGSNGSVSFAAPQTITTDLAPTCVRIADIDGDGKPDLAATNQFSNSVCVFRNTSTVSAISFAAKQSFATGGSPGQFAIGDLDGDGKPDLAVANGTQYNDLSYKVSILKNTGNTGNISFAPRIDYSAGYEPTSVTMGDFNGDGKPDLVVAGLASAIMQNVSVGGNIAFAGYFNMAVSPFSFAVADLDGDGKSDMAGGNASYDYVSIIRNKANEPIITSFTPIGAGAGATVSITGSNFTGSTAVSFGGVPATSFTVNSPNNITAVVGAATSGDISITNAYGTGTRSGFVFQGPPVITSFAPKTGFKGSTVVISGNNFTEIKSVSFGGVPATGFNTPDLKTINAFVGKGATGNIIVTNTYGADTISGFIFQNAPVITSFTPDSAVSGTTITITGKYLGGVNAVSFGGVAAASFNIVSATTITAVVGAGATGDVQVKAPGGASKLPGFVILPGLTSFSPHSGGVGTVVTINGSNFGGITSVTFGGISASSFIAKSPQQIQAVVSNFGTTGDVVVSSAVQKLSAPGFTFLKPVITSISPTSGTAGVPVTIRGKYLTGAMQVIFGGFAAPDKFGEHLHGDTTQVKFKVISDSVIVATVAAGIKDGDVSVRTAYGLTTFIYNYFTYTNIPQVTSFTPSSGPAGTTVNIAGTNFNVKPDSNAVYFGNTKAVVTKATAVLLTVTVPAGASYGKITVTNTATGLSAYSSKYFVVGFSKGTLTAGSFKTKKDLATGKFPAMVATGDLDGDGKVDLAVPNYRSGTVSLYRNTSTAGKAVFAAKVDLAVSYPSSVFIKDMDGDGLPDLVILHSRDSSQYPPTGYGDSITVFKNQSKAKVLKFVAKSSTYINESTPDMTIGDFDDDGKPDIIYSLNVQKEYYVMLNQSTKTKMDFQEGEVIYVQDLNPQELVFEDLDGDDRPETTVHDLSANNYEDPVISVYSGTTWGKAFSVTKDDLGYYDDYGGFYGDMDLDGKLDLIESVKESGTYNGFSIYRNTSKPPTNYPAISFAKPVSYLLVNKKAATSPSSFFFNTNDMDGDGYPDIIAMPGGGSDSILILKNNSKPGAIAVNEEHYYIAGGHQATFLSTADIDGDGKPDIILADEQANIVTVLLNGITATPLLPLTLTGNIVKEQTQLNWQGDPESGPAYFEVERSVNGTDFSAIGKIDNTGSLKDAKTLEYIDAELQSISQLHPVVYYRLKTGNDEAAYSNIIAVNIGKASGRPFVVYPNPARDYVTIQVPQGSRPATIQLADIKGRVIKTISVALGQEQVSVRVKELAKGTYAIIWTDGVKKQSTLVVVE